MGYNRCVMDVVIAISCLLLKYRSNDVPIVAAVVKDDRIISVCTNDVIYSNRQWQHAEFCAIHSAIDILNQRFLHDCDLYVNLEPCQLCTHVSYSVRLRDIYFSAYNVKDGYTICTKSDGCTNVIGGFRHSESSEILRKYFMCMRNDKLAVV